MLDKARNNLIKHSFQLAGIISPESTPTAEELADAAHTLNTMLQSWNNDGFRLFKIKTGYMPFISGKNEYNLSTQAYKELGSSNVSSFRTIGSTVLKPGTISDMSIGDKLVAINNTVSEENYVKDIDYDKGLVSLDSPLSMAIYKDDAILYGDFHVMQTEKKSFAAAFNSIVYSNYEYTPNAGDTMYFSINNNWTRVTVVSVEASSRTAVFTPSLSKADITNDFVFVGRSIKYARSLEDGALSPRLLVTSGYDFVPDAIALPSKDGLGDVLEVERYDEKTGEIILTESMSTSVLQKLGKERIDADVIYPNRVEMSWQDVSSLVTVEVLDWGYVREIPAQMQDWGFVRDPHSEILDWGNLTGDAKLAGFAKRGNDMYSLAQDESSGHLTLFYKLYNSAWSVFETESYGLDEYNLYMYKGSAYLFDMSRGFFGFNGESLESIYSQFGVEAVIEFGDGLYLVSPIDENTGRRMVTYTEDLSTFEDAWEIELPSVEHHAEFLGKLFIGEGDTYVTSDMKNFVNTKVYSENRCVVGDRLINLNVEKICSYTLDGVNFKPMPMMLSYETTWAYKDGCSFIAIYGVLTKDGYIGTQIFTANDFNPIWTPQISVPGKVFNIFFDSNRAYFLSDMTVMSLEYYKGVKTEGVTSFGFGKKIGRPQEVMNVMKYDLEKGTELPMNPLSLKDFVRLPKQSSGEPVNYCFLRDAIDGKMMVWGTPNKFGEYLKFCYVEPITLLEEANSTPDFPEEYYEAVEDGLAAELAYNYQLPIERIQMLQAKAQASKEDAMLHDNEDTSYDIVPNQRGL